jgi:glycosyltransferase involved in cell wall biosynthesis
MKIIIIGPAFPWRGGIAHHTNTLALNLKKKHNAEVITFRRQYPKLFFPGKSQYDPSGKALDLPISELIDTINPFNWILTALQIRKKKADLIIFTYSLPFFGPCFGTIAAIARCRTNTKTLFLCHNIIPHEHRIGDTIFTKFAFTFSDYFLVQSITVEQDLLKIKKKANYLVSPHPLYEMFGNPIPKEDAKKALNISTKKVILYFGYIRQYKGLTILIKAMEHLPDILLLVVGEFYDDKSKYVELIHQLNLESRIRVVDGYVPNEQVPAYFSAADAVILPYLSATQSGIAQIAYNFDKPVIASNVGGLAEVILDDKTGFVIPPNDSNKLAEAISKFYHQNREKEFSENVKIEKTKYSWEHFVETIEKLVRHK